MISKRRSRGVRLILLVCALAAVAACAAIVVAATENGPSVNQVEQTFEAAMQASRAMTVPITAAQPMVAGQKAVAPSASAVAQQEAVGQADISKYFSGAAAQLVSDDLKIAISNEASGTFHVLGSGVSKVDFTNVAVSGTHATVTAAVTEWLRSQAQQQNGTWIECAPSGVMNYTAQLVEDSAGDWKVSSFVGDFAPGYAP